MKIGKILVSRGLLTQTVLEKALSIQKEKPQQRIGEIFLEMGALGEEELFSGLSEQLGIPLKKDFQAFFSSELVGLISFDSLTFPPKTVPLESRIRPRGNITTKEVQDASGEVYGRADY